LYIHTIYIYTHTHTTGTDRYCCIYLSFGDRWVLVGHEVFNEDDSDWVHREREKAREREMDIDII
jgi:hypothetical protein